MVLRKRYMFFMSMDDEIIKETPTESKQASKQARLGILLPGVLSPRDNSTMPYFSSPLTCTLLRISRRDRGRGDSPLRLKKKHKCDARIKVNVKGVLERREALRFPLWAGNERRPQ